VNYTPIELMICCAARTLEPGSSVAVGTGIPCAAAMLAQRTHAPDLIICFEAGGVAPQLPTMPISVGDSRTFYRGVMATSMADVMQLCQRGMIDYTFLGGAQIDPYGNLNSTVAGDYAKPTVRFPGSGGANDLASFCWRTMVVTQQNPRRFVEKLDFLTSPGYLTGPGAREEAGLPPGTGPHRVITDLAVMGYAADSLRMQVLSLHPGVDLKQVHEATGFKLEVSASLGRTDPPTSEELRILRDEVDPRRYILGRAPQ
jgi:glutaconate CoA-transferase subunit B